MNVSDFKFFEKIDAFWVKKVPSRQFISFAFINSYHCDEDMVLHITRLCTDHDADHVSPFRKFSIICYHVLKVGLLPSKKTRVICFIESPSNMMKNTFYFTWKFFSFSRYLRFCNDFLVGLIRKIRLILKSWC